MSKYLGTDAVELAPDAEEVWLPVADHDVADVGLLQAVHHAGGHRALREVILSHLEIKSLIKCWSLTCYLPSGPASGPVRTP